jgi:hypothetical protein
MMKLDVSDWAVGAEFCAAVCPWRRIVEGGPLGGALSAVTACRTLSRLRMSSNGSRG